MLAAITERICPGFETPETPEELGADYLYDLIALFGRDNPVKNNGDRLPGSRV